MDSLEAPVSLEAFDIQVRSTVHMAAGTVVALAEPVLASPVELHIAVHLVETVERRTGVHLVVPVERRIAVHLVEIGERRTEVVDIGLDMD